MTVPLNHFTRHTWRRRFAWWPVALWRNTGTGYVERSGRYAWWLDVIEIETWWEGWIAYEHFQPGAEMGPSA